MRPSRDSRFVRLLLMIFFVLAIGYAGYEAQGLLFGPEIHLAESARFSDEAFILIAGTANRITELRLNGTTISVRENGEFSEPYLLAHGANRVILEARDARGRTALKTLDIVYRAPVAQPLPEDSQLDAATSSPSTIRADA